MDTEVESHDRAQRVAVVRHTLQPVGDCLPTGVVTPRIGQNQADVGGALAEGATSVRHPLGEIGTLYLAQHLSALGAVVRGHRSHEGDGDGVASLRPPVLSLDLPGDWGQFGDELGCAAASGDADALVVLPGDRGVQGPSLATAVSGEDAGERCDGGADDEEGHHGRPGGEGGVAGDRGDQTGLPGPGGQGEVRARRLGFPYHLVYPSNGVPRVRSARPGDDYEAAAALDLFTGLVSGPQQLQELAACAGGLRLRQAQQGKAGAVEAAGPEVVGVDVREEGVHQPLVPERPAFRGQALVEEFFVRLAVAGRTELASEPSASG